MDSTYQYNYLVADEVLGHTTYPDAFEHVFAHARANGSRNVRAECFPFHPTTRDEEFVGHPIIGSSIGRRGATRLLGMFRQLMTECKKENEVSWIRVFCTVRQLQSDRYMIQATGRDRMCPVIGVGTQETRYDREQLAMRGAMAVHCGLEAFVDLCTPDHRCIILVMVDATQRSRFGRIVADPKYVVPARASRIWKQWSASDLAYKWSCHAWFDAVMNNCAERFRSLGCRPVVGSMGLGVIDERSMPNQAAGIWWEYGNPVWTTFGQFVSRDDNQTIDAHFWLEDPTGRVYDVIRPHVLLALLSSGQMLPDERFPMDVCGQTKDELKKKGFHYVAAPKDTQHLLFTLMMRQQEAAWEEAVARDPSLGDMLGRHPQEA